MTDEGPQKLQLSQPGFRKWTHSVQSAYAVILILWSCAEHVVTRLSLLWRDHSGWILCRNDQRMVSQKEYEMLQMIEKHDPDVIFKALLEAKSAKVRLSVVPARRQHRHLHTLQR